MFITPGATSQTIPLFIQDSSSTVGAGLTGLVFSTANLTCYYRRQGQATWTAITLVTATVGTWVSGGFKQTDATHAPGDYEFGAPNACFAAGADWVEFHFRGAANMVPVPVRVDLRFITVSSTIIGTDRTTDVLYTAGLNLYVTYRDPISLKWFHPVNGMETYNAAHWSAYGIPLTEIADGQYSVATPLTAPATYVSTTYQRVTGSRLITDPPVFGGQGYWDGGQWAFVAGGSTGTFAGSVVVIPDPTNPDATTGYLTTLNDQGVAEAGVSVSMQMTKEARGDGYSFDDAITARVSNSNALWTGQFVKGASYHLRTGNGAWSEEFTVPLSQGSSMKLKNLRGS